MLEFFSPRGRLNSVNAFQPVQFSKENRHYISSLSISTYEASRTGRRDVIPASSAAATNR